MSWLPVTVTAEPASEPITVAEAKAQCRVTSSDEDNLLTAYIAAARLFVEQYTGLRIVEQTVEIRAGGFSDLAHLPVAPLQSITSIKYLDRDGAEQTLAASVYEGVLIGLAPSIRLKVNQSWPSVRSASDAVRVVAVAGYASTPEPIKQALLLIVASWFDSREVGPIPAGAMALLTNYRRER
ncbi:MAG: head-tail connector protein [Sphingomonadaceae bacterium]